MPDKVALELASQISNQNLSKEGWTTYYVDGTNGNDGANGLTWNSAFATIQHAVDTAESWAKIYVKAGTYLEEVNITVPNIILIGEDNSTTTISNGSNVPLTITADRCHVEELTIHSGTGTNTLAVDGDYTQITECIITGNRLAVGGDYNEISHCIASTYGFYFAGLYNKLHDCTSDGSGNYGILLRGNSRYNQIFNNNIWNATGTGIHLDLVAIGPSYNTIYHNNLVSNSTQVSDEGTNNSWIENYYDDHTTDSNNDGITDTPYTFTTGIDYSPVSRRDGWNQVSLGNVAGSSIAEIEANIGDFQAQTNLRTLLAALGIPDVAAKPLYTCLVTDRLDNATYGLSAIENLVDNLETRLTAARAGYLDELAAANIPTDLTNIETKVDANQVDLDAILVDTGNTKLKVKTFAETGTDTQLTIANGTSEVTIKTFDIATYGIGSIKAFKIDLYKATSGFQTLAAASSTIIVRVYEKIDATNYRLRSDDGNDYTWTQGVTEDKVIEVDDISFSKDCQVRVVLSAAPSGTINLPWLSEMNENMGL